MQPCSTLPPIISTPIINNYYNVQPPYYSNPSYYSGLESTYLHNSHNFSSIVTSKKLFVDLMFRAIYLSLIEEGTALVKYTFLLFFTENSFMKEEKLMKFLTDSCRMPILGAPSSIEVNFKHNCVNGCRCFPTVSICSFTSELPVHIQDKRKYYPCFQQH